MNIIAAPTPRPWIYEPTLRTPRFKGCHVVRSDNDDWIGEHTPPYSAVAIIPCRIDNGAFPPCRDANARLIAAAPDYHALASRVSIMLDAAAVYLCEWEDRQEPPENIAEIAEELTVLAMDTRSAWNKANGTAAIAKARP